MQAKTWPTHLNLRFISTLLQNRVVVTEILLNLNGPLVLELLVSNPCFLYRISAENAFAGSL